MFLLQHLHNIETIYIAILVLFSLINMASYRTDGSKKYPFCVGYKQNQNITSVQ